MAKRREPETRDDSDSRDYGFIAIVTLAIVVAVWLLLMPWVPAIARQTLYRFHLATPSFARWVAQFPIPSMYNCANEFKVQEIPPGLADPIIDDDWRYVNHFPARIITFGDGRFHYLLNLEDRWFTLRSSYRGQMLESRIHLEPVGKRGLFRFQRLSDRESDDE